MKSPTRRAVTSWLAGGALAATALTITTGVMAQENWDQVVAAAEKEGTVTLYSNLQPNGIEPLLQKFREAYPKIKTEQIRLGSSPLVERFSTEFSAGRHLADVMITYAEERVDEGMKNGWMLEWTPPEAKNFAPELNHKNLAFTIQQAREAIIWNKNLVKPGEEPKDWKDLFDPKWKGKIGMNPPWRSISIQQIVAYWEDKGLGDTAQKLKDMDVRFFEGSGGIIQAIIRGDIQVAELSDLPLNPLLADGAPVGFVYPDSGTTLSSNMTFVAKNAPHPNAGKVLVNWLMTEEGQKYLQEYCGLPVTRNGAPPLSHTPATAQLKNAVDGATILTPERSKKMVEHWRTVFGVK
jgi:iron(III) transport system substrate-binding protein